MVLKVNKVLKVIKVLKVLHILLHKLVNKEIKENKVIEVNKVVLVQLAIMVIKETEEEAISAWNTRAERTCHAELNAGRNAVVCSECGSSMLLECWEELIDWGGNTLISTFRTFPYCPNCGARVLEES